MGHNSHKGFFLGQELLLDFLPGTSNIRAHFASLKHFDDLPVYQGYDASQPLSRHARFIKTTLHNIS